MSFRSSALRGESTASAERRGRLPAGGGKIPASSSPGRTAHPPSAVLHLVRAARPRGPASRGSGCTMCVTATPRPRTPPASRPRSSPSGSGTPASPSPWTPIATSHVLPGLDAEAAGTLARLILGDQEQAPARPVDNGPEGPEQARKVKGERPGQRGVRAGGFEPPRVAPPGPKLCRSCGGWWVSQTLSARSAGAMLKRCPGPFPLVPAPLSGSREQICEHRGGRLELHLTCLHGPRSDGHGSITCDPTNVQ
jgi:hypothetical protein